MKMSKKLTSIDFLPYAAKVGGFEFPKIKSTLAAECAKVLIINGL